MLAATLLALGSAAVHAAWNLIIKTSTVDRRIATWGVFLVGGLLAPPGASPSSGCRAGSRSPGCCSAARCTCSTPRAWPPPTPTATCRRPTRWPGAAARCSPRSAACCCSTTTSSRPAWVALAVVAAGLVSIRGRGGTAGLGWAAFTAVCIAVYTLIDSHGAREADSGIRYGLATIPGAALGISLVEPGAGPGARAAGRVADRVAPLGRRRRLHRHRLHARVVAGAAGAGRLRDRAARVVGGARRAGRLAGAARGDGRPAPRRRPA